MMIEKLMSLFQAHLKAQHNLDPYDYQLDVARKIFTALVQNLRLTAHATEEDIKNLKLVEIPIEFSRQSGKTTTVVHVIEFAMIFLTKLFDRPIAIGIFAPQREQSKTDFDRLKAALLKVEKDLRIYEAPADEVDKAKGESNAKTIVLPNGSSCYVFPVTTTSKPESKTLDLIIFEESQDLVDRIVKEQIWPMGASTNAPRVYIGTAGTRICYFYRLGQGANALKLYFDQIAAQRRRKFEQTGNALHLIYERTVIQEIELAGEESDEIQRPYFGKWLIGTGQFVTQDALELMVSPDRERRTFHDKDNDCYAGIDTAKHPDSTVVTILRALKTPIQRERVLADGTVEKYWVNKQVLNWLELRGENYKDQFDIIMQFLSNYKVVALAIDSTGQGDFMPDMFERESGKWMDENTGLFRLKFSAVSKDIIYKNLKVSISELLTDLPNLDTREAGKFKQQLLDLQQEYKGQLLSVHHPDDDNAHDDYPDSWALAEYAFAKYNENRVSLSVISHEPEKKVAKNSEGEVTDYWPGLDE
jgi:hypothetical protein